MLQGGFVLGATADPPTRTQTLTLGSDQCLDAVLAKTLVDSAGLDAVARKDSRLIRPAGDAVPWKDSRLIEPLIHLVQSECAYNCLRNIRCQCVIAAMSFCFRDQGCRGAEL